MITELPKDVTLDGELFGGRGEFQTTAGIVKTMGLKGWKNITFQILDVPSMGNEPFEGRLQSLQENFGQGGKYHSKEFVVVDQTSAESYHVFDMFKEVEAHGEEGLMLRKPGSKYEGRRSSTLLKIKPFFDAEAEVTGYVPGKGKHTGSTDALKCKMASGKAFAVGSGLSDRQRARPPKVGTIIVYRFQELTKDGVPSASFQYSLSLGVRTGAPTFVGEAADEIVAKDADVPASKKV
ncbi:nucleic acid-binding protein [Stereum hirsutum FP-91666 SS1]|uniref:Nucleic acid-binding protein n=1 Tax=Stereum hirsutum (strain FP-91666) TaxID=721885 RepID=R7RXM6_STEHR|nr:nucleic acid-binding protein [Stereum hirsutum FP-91666 SS1]EIM79127.1 nucleic acid-binding protein [Stereum hirsutum FP-91666 SS1]